MHCLKYGLTVHNVRRVRGVLITGEVVEFGGDALDSAGYDLLALIHGSEGLLAVTTEITVKLTPKPQTAQVALAAFADVGAAGAAVAAVIGAGIVPAGLEMMDRSATRAVEEFVHAGYPLDAAAVLLVETDGTPEEVAADMAEITRVLAAAGATGIRVSKDERERLLLWSGRKAAFPAVGRITPGLLLHRRHDSAPRARAGAAADRSAVAAVQAALRQRVPRRRRQPPSAHHVRRQRRAERVQRAEAFGAEILELCIEVGGTITGEHGVGIEKLPQMCVQFRPAELECFLAVKAAFDPQVAAQSGQGRAHAVALRGVRQDARPPRQRCRIRSCLVSDRGTAMNTPTECTSAAARRRATSPISSPGSRPTTASAR